MGKHGDQIQRLAKCPAEVFVVQYWAEIDDSVLAQLEQLIQLKSFLESRQLWYGIVDGQDSARLIQAYPKQLLEGMRNGVLIHRSRSPRHRSTLHRCDLSSRRSQALASFQSRFTVSDETPRTSAVSSTVSPPKNRSSTTWPFL